MFIRSVTIKKQINRVFSLIKNVNIVIQSGPYFNEWISQCRPQNNPLAKPLILLNPYYHPTSRTYFHYLYALASSAIRESAKAAAVTSVYEAAKRRVALSRNRISSDNNSLHHPALSAASDRYSAKVSLARA